MKIARVAHEPGQLLDFYEEGLTNLGALCERTWHDRLQVIAEGSPAVLFNSAGDLHEVELHFAAANAIAGRDAAREVFPGCPLTFRLAETLRAETLQLDRFVLAEAPSRPPDAAVAEKRWRAQFPEARQWRLTSDFKAAWHFTLAAIVRCEIQAIDQHWSLHRLALSLPGGESDDDLAGALAFHENSKISGGDPPWPRLDLDAWQMAIERALLHDLGGDLDRVRARQENSLRRELDRIDDYFAKYGRELTARRGRGEAAQLKAADRLTAARAEHARRREDQVFRHEIRVVPHIDALVLVSENAWRAEVRFEQSREIQTTTAVFVPRLRRWQIEGSGH